MMQHPRTHNQVAQNSAIKSKIRKEKRVVIVRDSAQEASFREARAIQHEVGQYTALPRRLGTITMFQNTAGSHNDAPEYRWEP